MVEELTKAEPRTAKAPIDCYSAIETTCLRKLEVYDADKRFEIKKLELTMRYKYFTDKERLKESIESNTSSNVTQPYGIEGRKLHAQTSKSSLYARIYVYKILGLCNTVQFPPR